jgi:hypothetical protein
MVRAAAGPAVALERGGIEVHVLPRIGHPDLHGLGDVQRTLLRLDPDAGTPRLLAVGRKRLPDAAEPGKERYWGFVGRVGRGEVDELLSGGTYETKTLGRRVQPPSRRVAKGRYAVVRHGTHTHLSMGLEAPLDLGDVQRDLRIEPRASYVVAAKNPARDVPPGLDMPEAWTRMPPHLQALFAGRRWACLDPPALLDCPGLELLLVSSNERIDDVRDAEPEDAEALTSWYR